MLRSQIAVGTEYALRERGSDTLQRVRILEHVRGSKWKAEWVEPNPGLVHYVDSGNLITTWKDRKTFLKGEEDARRLREHNAQQQWRKDSPTDLALYSVFDCLADPDVSYYRGVLRGSAEGLERLKHRARMYASTRSPVAYVDRQGQVYLPFDEALEIARRFSAAEPSTVLLDVKTTERKWAHDVDRGEEHLLKLLNEYRGAWALIRQWAGHDAAVAEREAEIKRLERLVWDAVYVLQKAGLDKDAARLRRAVERSS